MAMSVTIQKVSVSSDTAILAAYDGQSIQQSRCCSYTSDPGSHPSTRHCSVGCYQGHEGASGSTNVLLYSLIEGTSCSNSEHTVSATNNDY